ncbi:MAG: uracil-DNA glycosylase [Nitrospinae bacterium]|nr:uracil-DNA glycosylase [Nitrospinota bacterium]
MGRKAPSGPSTAQPRRPADSGGRLNPALASTREEALSCTRCPLHRTRTQVVFGAGSEYASLVFIGEGPGADEDLQGKPFVGRAGQLLTRLLQEIGIQREEVYITNVVKCRPPNNRNPQPDEIAACEPYLIRQREIIRPKLICTLGSFAAQTLLKTQQPISRLRGRLHPLGDQNGHDPAELASPKNENVLQKDSSIVTVKVLPTYHPAFILRYPAQLKVIQEDFQLLKREYEKVMEEKA